jgi:hypothetical protein
MTKGLLKHAKDPERQRQDGEVCAQLRKSASAPISVPVRMESLRADGFGLIVPDQHAIEFARHGMKIGDYEQSAEEYAGIVAEEVLGGKLEKAESTAREAADALEAAAEKVLEGGKREKAAMLLFRAAELVDDFAPKRAGELEKRGSALQPGLVRTSDGSENWEGTLPPVAKLAPRTVLRGGESQLAEDREDEKELEINNLETNFDRTTER